MNKKKDILLPKRNTVEQVCRAEGRRFEYGPAHQRLELAMFRLLFMELTRGICIMKENATVSVNQELLQVIFEGAKTLYPEETLLLLRDKKEKSLIRVSELVVPPSPCKSRTRLRQHAISHVAN